MGITTLILVKFSLIMFWFCDVLNMPFMRIFDVEYTLNGAFWMGCLLTFLLVEELVCDRYCVKVKE